MGVVTGGENEPAADLQLSQVDGCHLSPGCHKLFRSPQKKKAPGPEEGESGEKRQRAYHNIVLQKAVALKFAEVNAPVEVECQIVGLGDRNLVGDKIKTEQVKDHPQQKWYSCYQEEVVVGEGNRVTLRLRNSTTRDTTRFLRPGDIVAKTLL